MMASSKFLFCSISLAICLVSSLLVNPITCEVVQTRLYVFGTALIDSGNHLSQNPTSIYGKHPFGMSLDKSQQSAYGMGRISDGLEYPDFIAQFAGLGIIQPARKVGVTIEFGANFAYPAAFAVNSDGKSINQVQQFTNETAELTRHLGSAEAMKVLKNSVYLFSLGRSDYVNSDYKGANQSAKILLVNSVINGLKSAVTDIYKLGGRKFAFVNVDNMGCTPMYKQLHNLTGNQCVENLSELSRLHNSALPKALADLQTQLPGLKYSVFDLYTILEDRQKNPGQYGFNEAFAACCGTGQFRGSGCGENNYELCPNPSDHLYFISECLSQAAHYQIARQFWIGGQDVASPYNMKQLFQTNLVQDI